MTLSIAGGFNNQFTCCRWFTLKNMNRTLFDYIKNNTKSVVTCHLHSRQVHKSLFRDVIWLFFFLSCLQALLQDLGRGQAAVAGFNELSAHLLHEYSADDTRRIKEVTDKHNAVWSSINNRWTESNRHTWLSPPCQRFCASAWRIVSFPWIVVYKSVLHSPTGRMTVTHTWTVS